MFDGIVKEPSGLVKWGRDSVHQSLGPLGRGLELSM